MRSLNKWFALVLTVCMVMTNLLPVFAEPSSEVSEGIMTEEAGEMVAEGLVQDNTGNFYSLETEHNGAFGAITNAEGLEKLKTIYGITRYGIGNKEVLLQMD